MAFRNIPFSPFGHGFGSLAPAGMNFAPEVRSLFSLDRTPSHGAKPCDGVFPCARGPNGGPSGPPAGSGNAHLDWRFYNARLHHDRVAIARHVPKTPGRDGVFVEEMPNITGVFGIVRFRLAGAAGRIGVSGWRVSTPPLLITDPPFARARPKAERTQDPKDEPLHLRCR